ncbi:Uncharacterised protein [Bordetella pertussis]|nr:Uncharacterised protein [Bordetella pertussis]
MACTREISACAALRSMPGSRASIFMGMVWRKAPNPLCICAASDRARARARRSAGHSCASGWRSATYSQMASESQTAKSPSSNTGTRPAGVMACSRCVKASVSRPSFCSSNGMPAWRSASQARRDQDE